MTVVTTNIPVNSLFRLAGDIWLVVAASLKNIRLLIRIYELKWW